MNYLEIAAEAVNRHCHQDIEELAELLDIIHNFQPKTYVEIGTYYGTGTRAVQQVAPKAKIICIDNNSIDAGVDSEECLENLGVTATFINGDSNSCHTVERLVRVLDGEPIDFFFIDGCHDYAPSKKDFQLYLPYVRKGGVIALHDIYHAPHKHDGVGLLWEELKAQYKTTEISRDKNLLGVGLVWL